MKQNTVKFESAKIKVAEQTFYARDLILYRDETTDQWGYYQIDIRLTIDRMLSVSSFVDLVSDKKIKLKVAGTKFPELIFNLEGCVLTRYNPVLPPLLEFWIDQFNVLKK